MEGPVLQTFMESCNNLGQDSHFFINWHLSSPMCAKLKEFNISPLQPSWSNCTPSKRSISSYKCRAQSSLVVSLKETNDIHSTNFMYSYSTSVH